MLEEDRSTARWSLTYVLSQALIIVVLGPGAHALVRVQTASSAAQHRAALAAMTPRARQGYTAHYALDMVHPLIYATALRAGVRGLVARKLLTDKQTAVLLALPVAAAAGDYLENVIDYTMLRRDSVITDPAVRVATTVSMSKWAAAIGVLGYLSVRYTAVVVRSLAASR